MSLQGNRFIKRLAEYGQTTGVVLNKTERRQVWSKWGLPDLRGFTPHLRQINIYGETDFQWSEIGSHLWLAHDLLHIAFYDFATLHLGVESWNDRRRFFENHLASELFSVLCLDYHYLIHTPVRGLAVDLDGNNWKTYQSRWPALPDLRSFGFCKILADLYLTGQSMLLSPEAPKMPTSFYSWLGHEVRYSQKQRHYVLAWREDLEQVRPSKKQIQLADSFVAGPLWELIQIFHASDDKQWQDYLKEVSPLKATQNSFNKMAKFRKPSSKKMDFRFTDIFSIPVSDALKVVDKAREPVASDLFLFWQILSTGSPSLMSKTDRQYLQRLALSVQTNRVNKRAWSHIRALCEKRLRDHSWTPNPRGLGTFFLP